ncbi:uncharacterized protein LOC111341888 isoform X2 [Stylophora pistillata]|uniref:uncharacterized protein LOC111341888 isoform X2 n=1 Tax=Stylophora pistillata TaxID=50429 RepID=UPI000C03C307|nr:uncharacterized protein LOC111341888 isoform X2 [Stylophora pistillata]
MDLGQSSRKEIEKRREEERLIKVRNELVNYDFHAGPRVMKESFRGLDVDDIDLIRIALIGPAASGKTSFVGTLQRAIGETQSSFEQGTGREGTILLEECYVQKGIRLIDTRGFLEANEEIVDECLEIVSGRIRPGEEISRDYDDNKEGKPGNSAATRTPSLARCAHAVIFVVKANDPCLSDGKYRKIFRAIKGNLRQDGYAPVTVITFLDELKTEEHKEEASDLASAVTGSSSERTYFIANYTHENAKQSNEVDLLALEILDSVLLLAEKFILVRKQREKNEMDREVMAKGAFSFGESLEQFFTRLKNKYHWTDQGRLEALRKELRRRRITTVRTLRAIWDDINSELPLSIGIKKTLEKEFKRM